jgi:hypothetical protein
MKLTSTQRALLSTALPRDDGTLKLRTNLKDGAAQKAMGKLLMDSLLEEGPPSGSMPVRRKDGERAVALRITAAGLAAIQAGDAVPVSRRTSIGRSQVPLPCFLPNQAEGKMNAS